MIDRIPNHVGQRIAQAFENGFVELDLAAFQLQLDVFAQIARQVAHQPRKLGKQAANRLHASQGNHFLQFGRHQTHPLSACADALLVALRTASFS